jgi:hypothetical protein
MSDAAEETTDTQVGDAEAQDDADAAVAGDAAATTEIAPRPSADDARGWTGYRLDEIGGGNVGKIEGVFVDAENNEPEWLLARMGRFGHYTLIPGRDAVAGVKHVWVPYTRDQIRAAPKVDPSAALTAGGEREMLAHYGVMADAGRAAAIAERDAGDVTAKPLG